ncbi:hypothetical protein Q5P01_010492 [Channa striata]|uniref:Uncharacterized protein n=1 Tax=Channa striata TaxID=64152 RepID=A0AA88SQL5_CHASR|nr:hypothetical protein Q5P01_010492 [Channa striata]
MFQCINFTNKGSTRRSSSIRHQNSSVCSCHSDRVSGPGQEGGGWQYPLKHCPSRAQRRASCQTTPNEKTVLMSPQSVSPTKT